MITCLAITAGGCSEDESLTGQSFAPAAQPAKEYVLEKALLSTVDDVSHTPPGPVVTQLTGTDEQGRDKIVWLRGDKSGKIDVVGSVLLKDGISQEQVLALLQEKGHDRHSVDQIFVAPLDNSGKQIVWRVTLHGPDQHSFVFDFKTGELLLENDQKMPS